MGMYTQLETDLQLMEGTPMEVISVIEYMIDNDKKFELTDHELFQTDRFSFMLRCGSSYFHDYQEPSLTKVDGGWRLKTLSNFKNYSGELRKFIDFIRPYVILGMLEDGAFYSEWYEEAHGETLHFLSGNMRKNYDEEDYSCFGGYC